LTHLVVAESVAWQTAVLCLGHQDLTHWIVRTTGMRLWLGARSRVGEESHAVVVYFRDGVLALESLASANVGIGVAFRAAELA